MPRVNWSTDEITLALALYLRTPYNRIHPRNPEIQKLATYLGRTEGAVSKKLAFLELLKKRSLFSQPKRNKSSKFVADRLISVKLSCAATGTVVLFPD